MMGLLRLGRVCYEEDPSRIVSILIRVMRDILARLYFACVVLTFSFGDR